MELLLKCGDRWRQSWQQELAPNHDINFSCISHERQHNMGNWKKGSQRNDCAELPGSRKWNSLKRWAFFSRPSVHLFSDHQCLWDTSRSVGLDDACQLYKAELRMKALCFFLTLSASLVLASPLPTELTSAHGQLSHVKNKTLHLWTYAFTAHASIPYSVDLMSKCLAESAMMS